MRKTLDFTRKTFRFTRKTIGNNTLKFSGISGLRVKQMVLRVKHLTLRVKQAFMTSTTYHSPATISISSSPPVRP